ncbi:unnamed protein product [Penicillium manginii]
MPSEKPSQALPSELEVSSADREDCHSQDDSKGGPLYHHHLFLAASHSSRTCPQHRATHIIGRSFDIDNQPGKISWISSGYSLTVGTFILIAGRFGDIFGHKPLFVGGYVWFAFWSCLAGVAVYSGPSFFIFCRAMQEIGPAFLLPNAIAIFSRCYDPEFRQNMIFCLFGATAPGGFSLGAVFSSLLAHRLWWPWSYWVLCFACPMLAALGFLVIPATPAPITPESESSSVWKRIDVAGSVAGVAALVLFNFALNQGPVIG